MYWVYRQRPVVICRMGTRHRVGRCPGDCAERETHQSLRSADTHLTIGCEALFILRFEGRQHSVTGAPGTPVPATVGGEEDNERIRSKRWVALRLRV